MHLDNQSQISMGSARSAQYTARFRSSTLSPQTDNNVLRQSNQSLKRPLSE